MTAYIEYPLPRYSRYSYLVSIILFSSIYQCNAINHAAISSNVINFIFYNPNTYLLYVYDLGNFLLHSPNEKKCDGLVPINNS